MGETLVEFWNTLWVLRGEIGILSLQHILLALAGIRTMVVMNISVSTFAVFIGAGGLGTIILQGIRTFHDGMLLAGTLLTALMAISAEQFLQWVEKKAR